MYYENVVKFDKFEPKKTVWKRKNKYSDYAKDFICFDSETSWNHCDESDMTQAIGWIYQWCFSYQGKLIYGRNASDFVECLEKIKNMYTNKNQKTIIFVHNLSYDLQYLKDFLIQKFGTDYQMLAIFNHKFITFTIGGFEFRCTLKLSNRSLAKWADDLNVTHKKLVGAIDYDVIRYPNTPLTKKDWKYMLYDVICLKECIEKEMLLEKDNIVTLPLTSTGYVRRSGRIAFKKNTNNRKKFVETALNKETYTICKKAFSGGLTHANRFFVDKTINGNIRHRDFTSHYPSQLRCKKFPIGKFQKVGENLSFDDIESLKKEYNIIMDITIQNIELRDRKETLPYLQESKVRQGTQGHLDIIADNGRILKCTGIFTISVTELDLEILRKMYKIDYYNIDVAYAAKSGYLPEWFCNFVDDWFYKKSYYKEKVKEEKTEENEINLMKSKNCLNGIYGMCATDIVRDEILMMQNGEWKREVPKNIQIDEILQKYYNGLNNFMRYQWGIYTTAWARYELMQMYFLIGKDNFLYSDTDSIFYLSTDEIERKIEKQNEEWRKTAEKRTEYIDTEKNRYFYHSFEDENENITAFRALHSKCYAYITDNKKLHCTIAGVQKRSGNVSREKELGNINNLTSGKVFKKCGGTRCVYIEKNDITNSCAIILKSEKTLNNSNDAIENFYIKE